MLWEAFTQRCHNSLLSRPWVWSLHQFINKLLITETPYYRDWTVVWGNTPSPHLFPCAQSSELAIPSTERLFPQFHMLISQESSQSISSVRTWINIQNQNPDPLSSGHTMLSPCRISTQSSMQQNIIYQVATLPVECKLHQGHKRLWAVLAGFPTPKLSSQGRHSVTISCMKSCHKSVSSLTQTDTERPIQSLDWCS